MSQVASLPISLSTLAPGQTARLHEARLDAGSVGLLRALGLAESQAFRVCKAGEPYILQVGATRIGLSGIVASNLYVIPEPLA
jgi:Fe2+ transport system protein FeoA